MFSAGGDAAVLAELQAFLEPLLTSPEAITALIARADSDGFEFDD